MTRLNKSISKETFNFVLLLYSNKSNEKKEPIFLD